MTRAEIERANAAHNLEETRFVSVQDLEATQFVSREGMRSAARRRNVLLSLAALALLLVIGLAANAFRHQKVQPPISRRAFVQRP